MSLIKYENMNNAPKRITIISLLYFSYSFFVGMILKRWWIKSLTIKYNQ